jgi:hypothetical protein
MSRVPQRTLVVITAAALVMTVSTTTLLAAEGDADESSLCDAITLAEVHALSPLRFEEPSGGSAFGGTYCQFGSPTTEAEYYSLGLGLSDLATVELAQAQLPGGLDLTVAGRPAYLVEQPDNVPPGVQLLVDLGPESLSVSVGASEGQPGLDPNDLVIAVAEVAAPRLLEAVESDDAQLGVPDVDGIEWGRNQDVETAEELIGGDEAQAAIWQPIFDATGAEPSELLILNVRALKPGTTDELGFYGALRIVGVDENALRAGFIDFMRNASGGDVVLEDISLGGRDVQRMAAGDQINGVLYVDGDTAHTFVMSEEDAARVIAALP